VTGGELTVADSDDELQKGMANFMLSLTPPLDSFHPVVQLDEVHLRSYSTPSGVASFDGALLNSSGVYGWLQIYKRDRKRTAGQREVEEH
jgi:hypothetical protein